MVAEGKGILAADESTGTIAKRFAAIGVENSEANRRDYRELLFRSPGIERYISGVILFDETLRQRAADGTPLVDLLTAVGVIPGHQGRRRRQAAGGRARRDRHRGARRPARAAGRVPRAGRALRQVARRAAHRRRPPHRYAIDVNAHALARYAALCQEAGLVPIVEPEVLMDGDHDIEACFEATEATLREVFYQLAHQGVALEGMVLKPNMVLSGKAASERATPEEVAEMTLACFLHTVPAAVPGIAFLSGGQGDEESTVNLDAINRLADDVGRPWELTFSYGRGLQAAPQRRGPAGPRTWAPHSGPSCTARSRAQGAFLERARRRLTRPWRACGTPADGGERYSTQGQTGILKEGGTARRAAVAAIVERVKGKVESHHFALGRNDFYIIAELPSHTAAAAVAATIGASGAVAAFETVALLTGEELDGAVKLSPIYRPPGR
jgi:fructose-bisphosphate aldolase, class I